MHVAGPPREVTRQLLVFGVLPTALLEDQPDLVGQILLCVVVEEEGLRWDAQKIVKVGLCQARGSTQHALFKTCLVAAFRKILTSLEDAIGGVVDLSVQDCRVEWDNSLLDTAVQVFSPLLKPNVELATSVWNGKSTASVSRFQNRVG